MIALLFEKEVVDIIAYLAKQKMPSRPQKEVKALSRIRTLIKGDLRKEKRCKIVIQTDIKIHTTQSILFSDLF